MSFYLSKGLLKFFNWEICRLGSDYFAKLKASTLVDFIIASRNDVFAG